MGKARQDTRVRTYWAFIPRPAEAMQYARVRKTIEFDSPPIQVPGCAGLVFGMQTLKELTLHGMQGSYSHKKCPEVPKQFFMRHMDWRTDVLLRY